MIFRICFTIAIALICIKPLRAQEQERKRELPPHRAELLKRIIDVLNSTADEAKKWDDKGVAAQTQAQIADMIWDVNQENARNHLKAAWTAAARVEEPTRERSSFVNPS